MVLGDAFFKTLALKQYFSHVADSVPKTRHQLGTVQLSADVPVKVVVNYPTLMMIKRPTLWPRAKLESLAMTMASGEARTLLAIAKI